MSNAFDLSALDSHPDLPRAFTLGVEWIDGLKVGDSFNGTHVEAKRRYPHNIHTQEIFASGAYHALRKFSITCRLHSAEITAITPKQ